jgi:hypothetical protein
MAKGFWNYLGEIVTLTQDFQGQQLADKLYKIIITLFTVRFTQLIGFVISCYTKQFMYTGYAAMFSTIVSIIVRNIQLVFFPWPFYNSHPLKWAKHDKKKT